MRQERKHLPEVICDSAAQVGQDPGLQPPRFCLSLSHRLDRSENLAFVSFSLDSALALFPWDLRACWLEPGPPLEEQRVQWRKPWVGQGWRLRHSLVPACWRISGKYALPPLAQFPLWSNQGQGPGIARLLPAIWLFDSLQTLSSAWVSRVLGQGQGLAQQSSSPQPAVKCSWSEAFSWKLQPRLRPGGLLLLVEPDRFQDVVARGKPSFLPGINKAAMAQPTQPTEARAAHHRPTRLSPREPPPFPAQAAAPWHLDGVRLRQNWGEGC